MHRSRQTRRPVAVVASALVALVLVTGAIALSPATAEPGMSPLELAQVTKANCQVLLAKATTSAARTRAKQCIADQQVIIDALLSSPTPSPSATLSPSPSPSPTVQPSPSVTPTATTAPPSPTPTVTVTPSPTVTGPVLGCMPAPSRCGWPDATNTGVPAGTVLTVRQGDLTAVNGGVYDRLDIRGCVSIPNGVNNVVIRNSRITCGGPLPVDAEDYPHSGILIEDVEVDMAGNFFGRGIAGGGFTARRVWWHNGSDCSHYNSDVVIEDSFCDLARYTGSGDPHLDGFQSGGGDGVLLRHNTIRNPNGQTSAIINGPDLNVLSAQTNVRIVDNLMAGGGFTVYCNAHSEQHPAQVPTTEFRGNRIARAYYQLYSTPRGGYWGPMTDCGGVPGVETTVWDEDLTPVPIG